MKYLKPFNERNISQANSIISKKMDAFNKLKDLLKNNMGYIGKFTEFLMNNNIPFEDLEKLYKSLNFLSKSNLSIDISKMSYEQVLDEIQKKENDLNVRYFINKFPSIQKKLAKQELSDESFYNLILKASKKQEGIESFISKISRYKDYKSLKTAIELFSKDINNDKENVISLVKKLNDSKIVYDKNNIVIVEVGSFDDIKKLASDTSWCILGETMWKSYTKNRHQFILYNYNIDEFDPKFKIGFTLTKKGDLYAAHDILDKNSKSELNDILSKNKIEISDIIKIEKIDVDFNKITSKTLINSLEEILNSLSTKEQYIGFIKKMLEVTNTSLVDNKISTNGTPKRIGIIKSALYRLCRKRNVVLQNELDEINPVLTKMSLSDNRLSRIVIYDNFIVGFGDNEEFINTGLDTWSDQILLLGLNDEYLLNMFFGYFNDNKLELSNLKNGWNKDNLTKLSDRLNDIYINNKISSFDMDQRSKDTLEKDLKYYVILTNYLLNRNDKVDIDFNLIKNELKDVLKKNPSLFKLNTDLEDYNGSNISDIPFINKKDSTFLIRDKHLKGNSKNFISELIKHLNNYKINFKVSKNFFKHHLYRYSSNLDGISEKNEKFKDFLDLFRSFKQRPRVGDFKSKENISIEVV